MSDPISWGDLETLASRPDGEWTVFVDDDDQPLPFEDADPLCAARLMGLVESAVGPQGVLGPTYHRITPAGREALAKRTKAWNQTLVLENFPRPEVARALSPNGRAHWATRRRAQMNVINHVTVAAMRQNLRHMHGHVVMHITLVYPVVRRRDDDNAATGVVKAVRDCLVKGGWLDEDDIAHLRQMPVEVRVEKGCRRLELRFEEVERSVESSALTSAQLSTSETTNRVQ